MMEDYRMHLRRALARQRLLDTLSDSWDTSHLDGLQLKPKEEDNP